MLNYDAIKLAVLQQTSTNTTDSAALVLMMKQLGFSPKKIKRELKKYRKTRNRILYFDEYRAKKLSFIIVI